MRQKTLEFLLKQTKPLLAAKKPHSAISPKLAARIKEAEGYGAKAYGSNIKAPAQDKNYRNLLDGMPDGSASPLAQAWTKGYIRERDKANPINIRSSAEPILAARRPKAKKKASKPAAKVTVNNSNITQTMKKVFSKAGIKLANSKDAVSVSNGAKGKTIVVVSKIPSISLKSMMRLRAYIMHRFKVVNFTTGIAKVGTRPVLKFSMSMKEVKKDKDGNHKLHKAPATKKPSKRSKVKASANPMQRIESYFNSNLAK